MTARATYFSTACARILYGTPDQPHRWHQPLPAAVTGGTIVGTEILLPDPADQTRHALALFHLHADTPNILDTLRAIAHRRHRTAEPPGLASLLPPWAALAAGTPPFTIAFLSRTDGDLPAPPDAEAVDAWSNADQWLWQLASRTNHSDFPPDPDHTADLLTGKVILSADWRGLVARDGAAFVSLRQDQGDDDPYLGFAQFYTHTTYTDALITGMIQNRAIGTLIDQTALAFDAHDLPRHLARLEIRVAKFRTIYWLRDASHHGPANDILTAYQNQHRLPDKFDAVLSEIADLNRLTQTQESARISAALGILTVIGIPYGAAFATLQVLGASTPRDLLTGLAAATAGTTALLLTRFGRILVRALRQLDQ